MPVTRRQVERLIVLFIIGCLALNYPLLTLFSKDVLWFGIPILYLYLFLYWALFIGLVAIVMEKKKMHESERKKPNLGK